MSSSHAFKRIARDASIYGFATAIGRMIGMLTAPVLTRIFAPADYGVIALVQVAISFAIVLAGMNIGSGIGYYFYKNEDAETRKQTISVGFAALVGMAAVLAGLLAVFAPQISAILRIDRQHLASSYDLTHYLRVGALGMFFSIIQTGFQSLLRLMRKPTQYLVVEVVALAGYVVPLLVLVVYLRLGIEGVFWAGVIGSMLGFLCGLAFVANYFVRTFSSALLLMLLAYALPQMPGLVINWFQVQLGRLFINYYATLTDQGLYSIAFAVASILVLGITAFRLAYDPYAMSIMKRDDASKTYAHTYSAFAFVFGTLLGLLAAFSKPILLILTPPAYHEAHRMVFWLAGAAFYMGANNIVATGIWLTGRTVYTSYAQIFAFISLMSFNAILVPAIGAEGAAISYLLGAVTQSLAYYYFAQRLHRIPFRYWEVHGMVILIVSTSWCHTQVVSSMSLIPSLLMTIPTAAITMVIAWFIGLNEADRTALLGWLRSGYVKLATRGAR
jgi:O-antigen/teichoic acid export membrane protein